MVPTGRQQLKRMIFCLTGCGTHFELETMVASSPQSKYVSRNQGMEVTEQSVLKSKFKILPLETEEFANNFKITISSF